MRLQAGAGYPPPAYGICLDNMTHNLNVAVVVLDTARASDAVSGDDTITPTLSQLAADGTLFRRAYACAPWTLPSHGSLFSGTHPSTHGAHGGHTYLSEDVPILSETLAGEGYETVGISNNTWITDEFGFARGFETFHRGWQYIQAETDLGVVAHELDSLSKLRTAAGRILSGNPVVNALNLLYSRYRPDDGAAGTTDRVTDWLSDRSDDRPFFLFVNYLEPHIPYDPPRSAAEAFLPAGVTYEEARAIRQDPRAYDVREYQLTEREREALLGLYRGELSYVDYQLGRMVDSMRDAGVWEDTLLVVLGDHGENIGDHGFLGHQYNVYDTLLHVPLVVTGGPFADGDPVDDLVQLSDIAPTICEVLGLTDSPLASHATGAPLPPLGTGNEHVVAEYTSPQPAIETLADRFGPLTDRVRSWDRSLWGLRTADWKLIAGSDGHRELYDVREDPGEHHDVAADRPDVVASLEEDLEDWRVTRSEPHREGVVEMTDATEERLASLGYL